MQDIDFSDQVLREIQHDRFKHPRRLVQERKEILRLKVHRIGHRPVAALLCASRSTHPSIHTHRFPCCRIAFPLRYPAEWPKAATQQ